MGRRSTAAAVAAGTAAAAGVLYIVVATAKPRRGSWRFKFRTWLCIKWPLTYKYLTVFDARPSGDDADRVASGRELMEVVGSLFTTKGKSVRSEDVKFLARDGTELEARVHIPPAIKSQSVPVVLYLHGGGFVAGSKDSHNTLCQILSHDGPFVVVAVDYRCAPEFKCPIALNDCVDALDWVADHVEEYGGDPARICVAGDSAGGNLTLATVSTNLARGDDAVPVRCQVAVYPVANCDFEAPSYKQYGTGFPLTADGMEFYFKQYVEGTKVEPSDPRVSVVLSPSFAGMPPSLVMSAEWDVLRDESFAVVDKLKADKVNTTHIHYLRATHGFFPFPTIGTGTDACHEFIQFVRAETAGDAHAVPTSQETIREKDLQED